jgi:ferric-dicitrate binding protein FerR (iron transport regulator)
MTSLLQMGKDHKEYTWNLIAKKLAGEATPEELKELDTLLRNNPELYYPFQTIADLWKHTSPKEKALAERAFSTHLDRMEDLRIDFRPAVPDTSIETPSRSKGSRFRRMAWLAIPSLCLIIGLTWYFQHKPSTNTPLLVGANVVPHTNAANEILTGNGSRTHLSLPDGTKVWLNAGSRIDYPKNFGISGREVDLTGEAFFDVAPDAGKPFVIHTRKIDIRVLGTKFNIKSYPTDRTTETTLIKGSIEVSIRNRPSDKIILKPNQKLVVADDDSLMKTPASHHNILKTNQPPVFVGKPTFEAHTGAMIETSWVDNKLIFQCEGFGELSRQMERWYGVSIKFDNPRLEELQFTGIFEKETVQQALDALKLTASFNYTIEGTQITIHD